MPRLIIAPEYADNFAALGLTTADDIFALPGPVTSGHPHRHVVETKLATKQGTITCFLKREHQVRRQTRWKNLLAGFGWSSMSFREYQVLRQVDIIGAGCGEVMAAGETSRGEAFILIRSEREAVDLRTCLANLSSMTERIRLARSLGKSLAELHQNGWCHGDLYSKHVLVHDSTYFVFLDWQRAVKVKSGSERCWTDLATLQATVSPKLLCRHSRWAMFSAYAKSMGYSDSQMRRAVHTILEQSQHLLKKRRIRELRHTNVENYRPEVHWWDGEAFCVTEEGRKDHYSELIRLQQSVYGPQPPVASSLRLTTHCHQGGALQEIRDALGKSYRSPDVNKAGLLFRLQAHEVPTEKLLAFGQKRLGFGRWESFLLTEQQQDCHSLSDWLRQSFHAGRREIVRQIGVTLARIHRAGCLLEGLHHLGITIDGQVVLRSVEGLRSARSGFDTEVTDACHFLERECRSAEVVRFLRSYYRTWEPAQPWKAWVRQMRKRTGTSGVRSHS